MGHVHASYSLLYFLMMPISPLLEVKGGDATAWGPPTHPEPLMPKSTLERRGWMGETPEEEQPQHLEKNRGTLRAV
jgi:hypothetical protein